MGAPYPSERSAGSGSLLILRDGLVSDNRRVEIDATLLEARPRAMPATSKRYAYFVVAVLTMLAACAGTKPQDRVKLGMTPKEVAALVGPPHFQQWFYLTPNETITAHFSGGRLSKFHRWHQDLNGEVTIQGWPEEGQPYATRFRHEPGRLSAAEWPNVPASEMAVLRGDSPAKFTSVYGSPPAMILTYSDDPPINGYFTNGKLDKWSTTWPDAIP